MVLANQGSLGSLGDPGWLLSPLPQHHPSHLVDLGDLRGQYVRQGHSLLCHPIGNEWFREILLLIKMRKGNLNICMSISIQIYSYYYPLEEKEIAIATALFSVL